MIRNVKPLFWLLASSSILVSCSQSKQVSQDLTLIINADIVTMNAQYPEADSILIDGSKIAAVGREADITPAGTGVKIVDLAGAAIIPGVVDSHVHVRELGMDKIKADLVGVETGQEIVARLQAFFPTPKPGEWLIGQGWDEGVFASNGYPDRLKFDEAFPDNPVYLESLHGFAVFVNGNALEVGGVNKDTPEPEVGDILRRPDGVPTGVLLTLARDLVLDHMPEIDQEQRQKAITAGLFEMAKAGVTSVHEAGMTKEDVAAFKSLADRNALPIRVYGMLDGNDEPLMKEWFTAGPYDSDDDFFDVRGIKVFYDGSLGSRTALMAAPYSDKPDSARPTERITPEAVSSLAERAAAKGFQMAVHAIGDEGNDRTLGIYERALEPHKNIDHRWRIEHAQVVLPDFYRRFAAINGVASMQSSHAVGDSKWAEDRVGEERIKHAYAWRTLLNAGVHLAINSDLPGEPWKPVETLHFAVNRTPLDGGTGWYMDQALTSEEALRAITIEGAYAGFQEDMLGSLTAGKWADFVVLDKNPLKEPRQGLKDIRVVETWVAGNPVTEQTLQD